MKEQLKKIFKTHSVIMTTKQVLKLDISWSLQHSKYVETDGAVFFDSAKGKKENISVQDYIYVMHIEEVNCEYVNCTVYINKDHIEEGTSMVNKILNKF